MAFAHTLELPEKLSYGPQLWTTLNQSLYGYFAVVGGPIEVVNVVVLVFLAVGEMRGRPRRWACLVAAGCFAAALVVWFAVVDPVNATVASWSARSVPASWETLRARWEYGHATRFALMLAGYGALVLALLSRRRRDGEARGGPVGSAMGSWAHEDGDGSPRIGPDAHTTLSPDSMPAPIGLNRY